MTSAVQSASLDTQIKNDAKLVIISIVSNNDFIAETMQQHDHMGTEVHNYNSTTILQQKIDLQQKNVVIINVDYEAHISPKNLSFIKNYSSLVKIIVLSNHSEDIHFDKISFITKPFNIQTLYNLIDNIDLNSYKIYQILTGIYFNPAHRLIIKFNNNGDSKEINLTEKENELLHYLVLHKERGIVSKSKLLNDIFGYKDASATHTLETHIYRLRNKISPDVDIFVQQDGGYKIS